MRSWIWGLVTAVVLNITPVMSLTSRAAETDGPAMTIRIQSISDILVTAEYLAGLAGEKGAEAKQGIALAKALAGDKGIEGIDTKRPIGMYANVTPGVTDSPVVVLLPVADEAALLNLLKERAMLEPKKDEKSGTYEVTPAGSPMTLYFRFANKYAYITAQEKDNIDAKKILAPEKVFSDKLESILAVDFRLDRLPEQMKKLAIAQLETQLAEAKEKPVPNETKARKALKDKAIDETMAALQSTLKDGKQLSITFGINPKTEDVNLTLNLDPTASTTLAKDLQALADNKSVVNSIISAKGAAGQIGLNMLMSSSMKKLLGPVVDEALEEAVGKLPADAQEQLKPLLKAIEPSLKAGELDAGISLIGPNKDGLYTFLFGAKASEATGIEKAVKDLVAKLPPDIAGKFAIDAAKTEAGAIHAIKVGADLPPRGSEVFGKNDLMLAFRNDVLVLAMGPSAKEAITEVLTSKPGASLGTASISLALAKIVPPFSETKADTARIAKAIDKVFGKTPKNDDIKMSIQGGSSLKVSFTAKVKAFEFMMEMDPKKAKEEDK